MCVVAAAMSAVSGETVAGRDGRQSGSGGVEAFATLDVEGVTNAVLNALDSLAQTLLGRELSITARETIGTGAATTSAIAAAAAAAAPAPGGAAPEGAGGGDRGGDEEERHRRDTKAELRAILLGEHAPFMRPLDVGCSLCSLCSTVVYGL